MSYNTRLASHLAIGGERFPEAEEDEEEEGATLVHL